MRRKFTRIMLIAVSALGLLSTALLLSDPPPPVDFENTPTIFEVNSTVLANSRQLASATSEGQLSDTLLSLNCASADQKIETPSSRFRLKGESCTGQTEETPTKTQVRNKSNGYVATVFHRTPSSFTTDYINLSEGDNEIEVRFDNDNGSVEKTLTVVRAPASVKK